MRYSAISKRASAFVTLLKRMRQVSHQHRNRDERARARGDAKYKICGGCSAQFQHDVRAVAAELGETTEYFVFQAAWDRYRNHQTKRKDSEESRKFIAFQSFLRDKKADPIVREFLEKLIDKYIPRHRP